MTLSWAFVYLFGLTLFFLCYNIRGWQKMKQRKVRRIIQEHHFSLLALVENKVKALNKEKETMDFGHG